jgi:chromate transporter
MFGAVARARSKTNSPPGRGSSPDCHTFQLPHERRCPIHPGQSASALSASRDFDDGTRTDRLQGTCRTYKSKTVAAFSRLAAKPDNRRMTLPTELPRAQPQSLTDLFVSFTILALQGFGGVLAVVQHELVERKRWITREEFVEEWAVAQIMPGPNVVNFSLMLGHRYFGLRGALAALAGMLTFPLLGVLLLALLYAQFSDQPEVAGALRGMGAVAAGLIAATGLKLMSGLQRHPLGLPICALLAVLCFAGIALLRLPLIYVLLGLGAVASTLTYRKLDR